jgi:histidinol phosphatase-like PHP family hydrolase
MIDLHTHTIFSDGELLPSELVYRAKVKGYEAIALTDHVDFSNMDFVIRRIVRIVKELRKHYGIIVVPGVEITYVPPKLIKNAVKSSRKSGAKLIVVHGETPSETVPEMTNHAGILSGADIIAHPGHITYEDALLAYKKGVHLEITSRRLHCKTNNHVFKAAKLAHAKLLFNSDTHRIENLIDKKIIRETLRNSGLTQGDFRVMQNNAGKLLSRLKLS